MVNNMDVAAVSLSGKNNTGQAGKAAGKDNRAAAPGSGQAEGSSPAFMIDIAGQTAKTGAQAADNKETASTLSPQAAKDDESSLITSFKQQVAASKKAGENDTTELDMKKEFLKGLMKRAQLLMPHQYTDGSWRNFIRLMKDSMEMAGKDDLIAINKAIDLMQQAFGGLRLNGPKPAYGNLLRGLPADQVKSKEAAAQEAMRGKLAASGGQPTDAAAETAQLAAAANASVTAATASIDVSV